MSNEVPTRCDVNKRVDCLREMEHQANSILSIKNSIETILRMLKHMDTELRGNGEPGLKHRVGILEDFKIKEEQKGTSKRDILYSIAGVAGIISAFLVIIMFAKVMFGPVI